MRIKKLTATFGGLDNAVLEPGPGLTVIAAPNEAGKSTWAAFWRAMLYGVSTREQSKTGFLADKARYLPWSGAPMSGEAQLEWKGEEITLRRSPTKTNPFGKFQAVYTASGDPVPCLTAAIAGERLAGVGKEVYLRSAFVGQGGAAIGASRELEARVAALATSGEEDVAYSAVERTLKDWRNRRRLNRANGLIPQMEEERSRLDGSLREMADARRRNLEAEQELEELEARKKELQADLDIWARIEKHELNRRYGEAYREWEQDKAAIPEEKPHPLFGTMTGEEAWALAQEKQKEREAAVEENHRLAAQRERLEEERWDCKGWMLRSAAFAAIWLVGMLLNFILNTPTPGPIVVSLLMLVCTAVFWVRWKRALRQLEELPLVSQLDETDWVGQAAEYRETLAKAVQARAAEEAARRRVDDLAAQGGQLFDTLEMLYPPAQSKEATAAQLAAAERELARTRNELARTDGALSQMGNPETLEARKSELYGQLARRLEEYDALSTALEALSAANDQLRRRFSPALNRKAGELFAALTGGRWDGLSLARDFSAQAVREGEALPRPALALSAGTAEQLYLAVRLAVCALTVPDAPILLDDALAAFDDGRMERALALLKKMGEERQILLFSCHSRELDWAQAHGVSIIRHPFHTCETP